MNATIDSPTIDKLHPALVGLLPELHARGITTHAYDDRRRNLVTWIVIERDGNVGTLSASHSRFSDEISVGFAIKPSTALGSSLLVELPGDKEPITHDEILQAAELAVGAQYRNFATNVPQPNHGWKHFDWTKGRLVEIEPGLIQGVDTEQEG